MSEENPSVWRGEDPRSVMWSPIMIALSITALLLWRNFSESPGIALPKFADVNGYLAGLIISVLTGLAIWFGVAYSLRQFPLERRWMFAAGGFFGVAMLFAMIRTVTEGRFAWQYLLFWPGYVYEWITCKGMGQCVQGY